MMRFGVETSSFVVDQRGWNGKLIWLLVLRRQLLSLTAVVEKISETGDAGALKISQRLIPLQGDTGARIDLGYRGRFDPDLRDASGLLVVGGEEIPVQGEHVSAKGMARFISAAMAAIHG